MLIEIAITKAVTINTGNYQNERIEVQTRYAVADGETPEDAYAAASAMNKAALLAESRPVLATLSPWERKLWLARLGAPEADEEDDFDQDEDDVDDGLDDSDEDGLYPDDHDDDDFEDDEDD